MPDLSRRMVVALVGVVAGLTFILLALFGGSSSSDEAGVNDTDRPIAIEPVAPLGADTDEKRPKDTDALDDVIDPFANDFGSKSRHKVTVRITANGPGRVGVRYRKGRQQVALFNRSYSQTRTVRSNYPVVQLAAQIFPPANRGSCTVIIDGVEVSSHTTTKEYGVVVCTG